MGLRRFERRLERLVEGTFARAFKSGLTPVEIGRRIVREIDAARTVGVDGSYLVPNHYWVFISSVDHGRFAEVETALTNELIEAARTHIADEAYRVLGPISVSLVEADGYAEGTMQVQAQWREGRVDMARLRLFATGEVIPVVAPFIVGRLGDVNLILGDENVSRRHAVIDHNDQGWCVRDLGSTNGTAVNGHRVQQAVLAHGDRLVFGATEATFELG